MQHQKNIAPNTKEQCTKDALHNSNHTKEAPPKLPMQSIPKLHICTFVYITPKMQCTDITSQKYCNQNKIHQSCSAPKMPMHNIPKVQIHSTNDAMHRRCSASKKYCNKYINHKSDITPKLQHNNDAAHQRLSTP